MPHNYPTSGRLRVDKSIGTHCEPAGPPPWRAPTQVALLLLRNGTPRGSGPLLYGGWNSSKMVSTYIHNYPTSGRLEEDNPADQRRDNKHTIAQGAPQQPCARRAPPTPTPSRRAPSNRAERGTMLGFRVLVHSELPNFLSVTLC